jgi:hypothetical protein
MPVIDRDKAKHVAQIFAAAIICGSIGFSAGFYSSYATARIAAYRLPTDCKYVGNELVLCLIPRRVTKSFTERAPKRNEIVGPAEKLKEGDVLFYNGNGTVTKLPPTFNGLDTRGQR